jgi:hypothetical protein
MSKVIRGIVSIGSTIVGAAIGFAIGGPLGATIGAALFSAGARALLGSPRGPRRAAVAATLQAGEQPRQAIFGRAAVSGSLVDAFNYGGKYGTDWEVLVIALADHRCDALEGFFVDDRYVAFTADGNVAGFNNQLQVFWRSGTWGQTVPAILTSNGPGWTANDRGRGVAYVVVAYKSDDEKAKNPVWPSGRPRFRWVVRGLRCYQPRKDSTVGGSGAHRRSDPATWEWTENPIDIRHNWQRGIYAGDLTDQPGMLLIGRGLSAIEAPPANVFARANLCDEIVAGTARYRIGGIVSSNEPFIDIESDFAVAVGGVISQPEGAVEVDPGEAKAPVAHFTDADLLVGSTVQWSDFLGQQDNGWINTVAARYVEPAQRWNLHSAPVRRELADIVSDGGPREQQPQLDFVTNGGQAQRVAEIIRRLGRLWGRGQVKLPPRFAFIEEGDWVTWQSDRHFGGATFTFRVEAWGSDQAWHHELTLRQISASVFSDTAPLDDGSIANDQPAPPLVAAPAEGAWSAAGIQIDGGGVRVPALRVTGAADDPAAQFVVFEYVLQAGAPNAGTVWTFASTSRPDVTRFDIPVASNGTFWVAVSYVVDGILGDRRVIGPITAGALAYPDGTAVSQLQPAEPGGTRNVARGSYDAGTAYVRGDEVIFSGSSYRLIVASSTGNAPPDVARWALIAQAGSGPAGDDGLPGISVLVSNEAHVVATAQDGSGGSYTGAGGQIRLLRGDTVLTPTFSIAAQSPASPSWISINSSTGVYTVTDPGVDLATATIRAAWAGVNYDRTYTLAKSKAGVDGADGASINPGTQTDDLDRWFGGTARNSPLSSTGGGATYSVVTPSDLPIGGKAIRAVETTARIRSLFSAPMPLDPTKTYKLSVWAKTTGNRNFRITTAFADAAGANISPGPAGWNNGTYSYWPNIANVPGSWRYFEVIMGPNGYLPTPANGRSFNVGFTYGDGGSTPTDLEYSTFKVQEVVLGPTLALKASAQAFTFTDGAAAPGSQTITLEALLSNLPGTVAWSTTPSVTLGGSGNTRTLSVANFGSNRQVTVEATLGGITDRITLVRIDRDTAVAAQALADAAAAQANADAANAVINTITSDNILSRDEKPEIRKQRDAIIAEYPTIRARAVTLGVNVGPFDEKYDDLIDYLATLAIDSATNTAITRPLFNERFVDYYDARQTVLDGIADEASRRASSVPAGDSNRVPFSRMEGDRGYAVLHNPQGLSIATDYNATGAGVRFFSGSSFVSAVGQQFSIGNDRRDAIKLTPGERLSVQSLVSRQGAANGAWQLEFWTYDASLATGSATVIASGTGLIGNSAGMQRAFVTVPANRWFGRFELRFTSTGSTQDVRLAIAEPMVTSATADQTAHPAFVPGPNADDGADVTATQQRTIVPQFPVIEVKQGEAGNVGNRTVTHTARRETTTITGGTWSLPGQNLGAGSASINSSTGTVTLSGIVASGAYTVRYTHTDGAAVDLPMNVTYVPAPEAATRLTVGFQEIITRSIDNGGSRFLTGQIARLAGGNSGTITARIEQRQLGASTWVTVATGPGSPINASEPGADNVSATFTNSTGARRAFEFRLTEIRSPGTAGGAQVASETFLEG